MRSGRDQDCLVCAIISHGHEDGVIEAIDECFYLKNLCSFFNSESCSVLAGKPKIFLTSVRLFVNYFRFLPMFT